MVQVFLLINKLNLKLKCKNHTHGCEFSAALTESINKSNNIGFTLNNHILRNHELLCHKCTECKLQCQHCKRMIANGEFKDHEANCRKRGRANPVNPVGNAPQNLTYNAKANLTLRFIMRSVSFMNINCDRIPLSIMVFFWLINALLMNFMKLIFIERFLRWPTYYLEQNVILVVFTSIFYSGHIFSVLLLIHNSRRGFINGNRARLHTKFKRLTVPLFYAKLFLWLIPCRILDIQELSMVATLGFGFYDFNQPNAGIMHLYNPFRMNRTVLYPMVFAIVPMMISYGIYLGSYCDPFGSQSGHIFASMDNKKFDVMLITWVTVCVGLHLFKESLTKTRNF